MMCAIYSLALYIIVALSSMPGISEAMNKAQWDFVFGPVCWTLPRVLPEHCMPQSVAVKRRFRGKMDEFDGTRPIKLGPSGELSV